ncbi:hypothetical protein OSSY52_04190 [Tepiditoga spiralis]|uniref:Homocysteine biosynthesis enzyme sulfur-incorporation domain-containing protein n=1 Tax=Tepiditoga spiralis TaxID=2108365 RepID=A0A7G1G246_9BACT|nr:homocysteine biosynthesis protein [Tepiditoga spiralis]BBE30278.1 hypothetical protein OSSY52_04190 [Tepiditoga spiralis]
MKTYEEINEKISKGEAVVVTAEEIIDIVEEIGIEKTAEYVDVVTTATFGPMCSSGAFLNFGHSNPPIRMQKTYLNGVEAYSGLAAVDSYIGASQESKNKKYGGAHVIHDLISGKKIHLEATSNGTDCYPKKHVDTYITKEDINEAYLFNPRNVYQNYNAATNASDKKIYTYMGTLRPNMGNINYSTTGELSPLLNDPYYKTIGIGTKIFLAGTQGYVSWMGTQFNSSAERNERGVPITPAGTLAVIGDLKKMNKEYIQPVIFKNYGISMFIGIGIPIPILNEEILKYTTIKNEEIQTNIIDYSSGKKIKKVNYKQLQSGMVKINGKEVRTASISNLKKARKIANELKDEIKNGNFLLTKPLEVFPLDKKVKKMKEDD